MTTEYNEMESIPRPPMIWENIGFWEAAKEGRLVFQRCKECGAWVHPPRPACPNCRSFEKEWAPSSGKGTIHSYVTYRQSPHPSFKEPYSVVLVDLEEGVRLVSNMTGVKPEEISIGMPVSVFFEKIADDLVLPKFRKEG